MKNERELLKKYLLKKNLRSSSRRDLILETFLEEEGHVKAEELYQKVVKKDPGIGIATVYRTLKLFHDAGLAKLNQFGNGQASYEHAYMHQHHDHLVCQECGKVIEFENREIEDIQGRIAKQYKFKTTSHRLELYGLCSDCDSEAHRYA